MSPSSPRPKPRRAGVATEEERAWVSFYRRVGHDEALAAEVLAQLDADAEMKRMHLALYLSCRESLRSQAARERRNARIGQFVRRLLHGLFVAMPKSAGRKLKHGGDIAVACLPEADAEPALAQIRRLASDTELGAAGAAFESSTSDEPAHGAASTAAHRPRARAAE